MTLSIITVTWNAREHIGALIESVEQGAAGLNFEHIIIDNNSGDETVRIVQSHPDVVLIQNKENRGFGAANNQGFDIAKGEFILFLNPDMLVEAGSLKILVDWMKKNEDVGLASVRLIREDGSTNIDALPRAFPTLADQLAILLKLPHIFPRVLNSYLMRGFDDTTEQEVDSVRGSFMLVRKETLEEIGFAFDPRYFIWFEDVDLCKEIWALGLKVVYTPIVSCVDYVGRAFKKQDLFTKQMRMSQSMVLYFQKWGSWYEWRLLALLRIPLISISWFVSRLVRM